MKPITSIFQNLPDSSKAEIFDILIESDNIKIERITSQGQATPPGEWYDQDTDEWVILLQGQAGLRFADETHVHELNPGDYVHIPAHRRHRVEWTAPDRQTVWLAVHYAASERNS